MNTYNNYKGNIFAVVSSDHQFGRPILFTKKPNGNFIFQMVTDAWKLGLMKNNSKKFSLISFSSSKIYDYYRALEQKDYTKFFHVKTFTVSPDYTQLEKMKDFDVTLFHLIADWSVNIRKLPADILNFDYIVTHLQGIISTDELDKAIRDNKPILLDHR